MKARRIITILLIAASLIYILSHVYEVGRPAWDEQRHALVALRFSRYLIDLDFVAFYKEFMGDALYPPLGRAAMGVGFLVFGSGFDAPRIMTAIIAIFGVWLSARLSRALVGAESAERAEFWTVIFALSGFLYIAYASTAMTECWSAFGNIAAGLFILRAIRLGKAWPAFVGGAAAGLTILIKYNYGAILIIAGFLCILSQAILERRAGSVAAKRITAWFILAFLAGVSLVPLWWFVCPFPEGSAVAEMHRSNARAFFDIAREEANISPGVVLLYLSFASCLSFPSFILQFFGVAWGAARTSNAAARFCMIMIFGTILSFIFAPARTDRYLIPGLPFLWPLGGAFCATWLARLPSIRRSIVEMVILIMLWATRGLGAPLMLQIVAAAGEAPENSMERISRRIPDWAAPYAAFRSEPPREDENQIIKEAAEMLDTSKPFVWFGGLAREFQPMLVRWHLYQLTRERALLERDASAADFAMVNMGYSEADFDHWVNQFPQIITIAPAYLTVVPDREFERLYISWAARHPGFETAERRTVQTIDATRLVTLYKKREFK